MQSNVMTRIRLFFLFWSEEVLLHSSSAVEYYIISYIRLILTGCFLFGNIDSVSSKRKLKMPFISLSIDGKKKNPKYPSKNVEKSTLIYFNQN